jgi:hypothetical protein
MSISQDYLIYSSLPPPAEYPVSSSPDEYSLQPFDGNYTARREAYLAFIRRNPSPSSPKALWYELGRLVAGGPFHKGILYATTNYIKDRHDCADFALHALLRLKFQFETQAIENPLENETVADTILNFKYWPDESGEDGMCTWTENHYILFSSAAYLAGQLYPDKVFSASGCTGSEIIARNRSRILRWINLRFYTGFSEWLSNVYYDEDLTALINLVDFSQDEEISQRAAMLIDLLLFDIALNNLNGIFGSTHGRTYENTKKWANQESTTSTCKLLFGRGEFSPTDNMSAIGFALSTQYHLPKVLYEIANDQQRPEMLNRQQMSFQVNRARWWNLNLHDSEDALHLLSMEAYLHPKFARHFIHLMNRYKWWNNPFFEAVSHHRRLLNFLRFTGLLPIVTYYFRKDLTRNTRESVNIYTYRTPDYMLSSAQDYRKGYGGDQQHLWQATLGPNAICFTTHPARTSGPPPNYWCGNGTNPRIAQVKNVLIAVHRITDFPVIHVSNQIFYSHAWFPRDQFEEICEKEGWIFGHWGDGYLALLSQYPYTWQDHPGEDQGREVIVDRRNNIWLCELGDKPEYGDFQAFIERILQAEVRYYGNRRISYQSPSQGHLTFGWNEPLRQNGRTVLLRDYPRYGNPYSQVPFPSDQITISLENETLHLNWLSLERQSSNYITEENSNRL